MRFRLIISYLVALIAIGCAARTSAATSLSQNTRQPESSNLEITQEVTAEVMPEVTVQPTIAWTAPEGTFTNFPFPIEGAVGPINFPGNINPLTGLPADDPSVLERRPIIVKISNAPPLVRPQAGIGAADIVYEHYTEGGLTRFSAVFLGQTPERVGSIRSARLIDHELVTMYQGVLAFSGASIGVEKVIYGWEAMAQSLPGSEAVAPTVPLPPSAFAERAYMGVLYGPPYYWRDESIPVPHNLFCNLAALWELAASEGYGQRVTLTGLAFLEQPPAGDFGAISRIDIRYRATRVLWEYDPATGLYRRFADGQGHFDANTGEQVTAANVVILYANHRETDIIESQFEDSISYGLSIELWGEGSATLFRDGLRYDGRWVRATSGDLIGLRTFDGQLLYLKPGNTWFQVVRPLDQMNPDEEWVNVE